MTGFEGNGEVETFIHKSFGNITHSLVKDLQNGGRFLVIVISINNIIIIIIIIIITIIIIIIIIIINININNNINNNLMSLVCCFVVMVAGAENLGEILEGDRIECLGIWRAAGPHSNPCGCFHNSED